MLLAGSIGWMGGRHVSEEERTHADADSGPGVLSLGNARDGIATSNVVAIVACVVLLAVPLYLMARRVHSAIG
jgi:hypothetical protein